MSTKKTMDGMYLVIGNLINNRVWELHFSFLKRNCYISGKPLKFKYAYRGRKKVRHPVLFGGDYLYDDIWLSSEEYLTLLSKGIA